MKDWAAINHPERPPTNAHYTFPTHRECDWCHQPGQRSTGRWVTKSVWVCRPCLNLHANLDRKEKACNE